MKWSLFNWKKPVVSSGEPEDYQVVKNTVSQNERNITNLNNRVIQVDNRIDTATANMVSTNTAQTITGAKTFSNQVVINNTPEPLIIKATNTNKSYILFKTPQNTSTLSIGSNATGANIDINSGDFTIETQQANKTITLNTGRVKLNRSALDLGTIINAGFGGTEVKFIPDDNSTKTLKFYENNQSDNRKFNLLVPEPTAAQNPATKQYVDTAISGLTNANLQSQIDQLNTFKASVENSYGYNLRYQDLLLPGGWRRDDYGIFTRYTWTITSLTDVKFMSAVIQYGNQDNEAITKDWDLNYSTQNQKIIITVKGISGQFGATPTWTSARIRLFYIDNLTSRTEAPFYFEEVNNEN